MTETPPSAWDRALRALALLAVNPGGLGGLTLRARAGPARQVFERGIARLPGAQRRIHPDISDTQLFGGPDIAATLAAGRLVMDDGLANNPALLILPMAERVPAGLAARLGGILDAGHGHGLILLDEGLDQDEAAPAALRDRLAFHANLGATGWQEARLRLPAPGDVDAARQIASQVHARPDDPVALTGLAARFGINSLRAPKLALCAARAIAALDGRAELSDNDLREAAELVYPARATRVPEEREPATDDTPPDPPPGAPESQAGEDGQQGDDTALPGEILVEAVRALLPPSLLDRMGEGGAASGPTGGAGAGRRRKGNRRGRPLPSRARRFDGRARIDVVATLRAAAPWQALRRVRNETGQRVIIHPGDIRLRRYEDRSDRLLIFSVDASGSAAMARLAEAKSAVELLLVQAYARRDHVAVIAFRGAGADVLLPPTRSLVQAKRRLAGMPGGGGTPLAAGLDAALALGRQARGRGLSPALALLTDGRANIALDGAGNRARAAEDAEDISARLRAEGLGGVVIDTSTRPGDVLAALARRMGARYLALPRARAEQISTAVSASLDA